MRHASPGLPWLRRLGVIVGCIAALAIISVIVYVATHYNPAALSRLQVTELVDRINELAAVGTPHGLDDSIAKRAHGQLFRQVEGAVALSDSQSVEYRLAYQEILRRNQGYLRRFDKNLTVLTDVRMADPNNVHGTGIAGAHDHHDASARSNYADLRRELDQLRRDRWLLGSVTSGLFAYKDLRDILLHLATAPHTKSVGYEAPTVASGDSLDMLFETLLREFKIAQTVPMHSPDFIQHLKLALDAYDSLVLAVQDVVFSHQSKLERSMTGTWAGWQSGTPGVSKVTTVRVPRTARGRGLGSTFQERSAHAR